jgi:hypothetical protein
MRFGIAARNRPRLLNRVDIQTDVLDPVALRDDEDAPRDHDAEIGQQACDPAPPAPAIEQQGVRQ